MRNNAVQIVLALLVLVFGGAAECLLPKMFGIGFPILLSASIAVAVRRPVWSAVFFAFAAGAMEDSLSGLPMATSAAFFLLMTLALRRTAFPPVVAVSAYPVYQLWLWLWSVEVNGSIFIRLLVSVPVGFATLVAVSVLLPFLERKAAVDGR